ncbi:MAG TPA: hypothetical protein VI455_11545 [Terriglobia bacterium]
MKRGKRSVKEIAYFQFKEFLVVFFYLWVVLALFALHKMMILAQYHIEFTDYGFAFINALALGKVMLVAKELRFADNFKDKPLIYPTVLKSAAFATLLICFNLVEEIAVRLYRGKTFQESVSAVANRSAKGFLSLGLLVFFMLIPFFGYSELSLVFGEGKLATLFFRSRSGWIVGDGAKSASPEGLASDARAAEKGSRT